MNTSRLTLVGAIAGIPLLFATTVIAQETCDERPDLSSCSTTAVGVCDAAAATPYVIERGNNNWMVLPMADDPLFPAQCSYEDDAEPHNPRLVTSKDDTNNLQCALDFAASQRTSQEMRSTITLKKGRYCIRDRLVGLDFSGTIRGAGQDQTVLDFDNPALKDAQGHLTGEGGIRGYWDIEKSVVGPDGEPVDLYDQVAVAGDQPSLTKSRRYQQIGAAGFYLGNNRFMERNLRIKDLHLNVALGTVGYMDTIHGFAAIWERRDSITAIVLDSHVLGGHSTSLGGRSNEFFGGRALLATPAEVVSFNLPESYEADTGVDPASLGPNLCLVPIHDPAPLESPLSPRNCSSEASCTPYNFDLSELPVIDTRFNRVRVTARGNTHNGLYYLRSERNLSVDLPVEGESLITFLQPVRANLTVKNSTMLGLGSPLVGTIMDFSNTPNLGGKINIKRNTIGALDEGGMTHRCGRLWEGLDQLSGVVYNLRENTIDRCQGGLLQHAINQSAGRGLDGGSFLAGGTVMPAPEKTLFRVQKNSYVQGPLVEGRDQLVASFVTLRDTLNNSVVEGSVGVPISTLEVRVHNNKIKTTDLTGDAIRPLWMVPIGLEGANGARIGGNEISGASAAAIAIGQEPFEDFTAYDVGTRIINNDLSGFDVVACPNGSGASDACSTGTADQADAATKKVWLGRGTSGAMVVTPDGAESSVGDLGTDNISL